MGKPRYAIYYAPAAIDPLWNLASRWIGRDAYTGDDVPRLVSERLTDIDVERLTASPRHYGFHATLKAPFELADVASEQSLLQSVTDFCREQAEFEVTLSPGELGKFLALRLESPSNPMTELHAACVRAFDHFRAELSDDDLARRRRARLSALQEIRLLEWGYPYIFDEFRFHMTLTGSIEDARLRSRVLGELKTIFPPVQQSVDGIAVFVQPDRASPFTILERVGFGD